MKILKWVFGIVLGIIALVLIVAIFLPSEYRFERSIVIEAPPEVVYEQVVELHNWDNWGPWVAMEVEVDGKISDNSRGVGAWMEWSGDTIGDGRAEIIEVREAELVRSQLETGGWVGIDIWELEAVPEGTRATWANEGELDYPLGRLMGPFLDGMLDDMYMTGLRNLKEYVENEAMQMQAMEPLADTTATDMENAEMNMPEGTTE